jgi:hypothetical protein
VSVILGEERKGGEKQGEQNLNPSRVCNGIFILSEERFFKTSGHLDSPKPAGDSI